jgi:predicted esterase
MKDRFRLDLRASKVTAPVLVVHGENDMVVPITLGERLYGLVQAPKRFVRVAGSGHNDLGTFAVARAKQFIAEQFPANQLPTPLSSNPKGNSRENKAGRALTSFRGGGKLRLTNGAGGHQTVPHEIKAN